MTKAHSVRSIAEFTILAVSSNKAMGGVWRLRGNVSMLCMTRYPFQNVVPHPDVVNGQAKEWEEMA